VKGYALSAIALAVVWWGAAQADTSVTADVFDAETLEQRLGSVTFEGHEDGGVVARFDIGANDVITAGRHAIHIHENADCSSGDADGDGTPEPAGAAGGHFNPTNVGHGDDNGPHVGDSAEYNYAFANDGSFTGDVSFPLASMNGENAILSNGGMSILIHEGTDDMQTDPGGDSGPRIACAVVPAN
jgi:Cu/Zn superoxide dismutase